MERKMARCLTCRKPFGLVRHWGRLRWDWSRYRFYYEQFCSEACEKKSYEDQMRERRVLNFLQWLSRPP